jgi:hypothetical protein
VRVLKKLLVIEFLKKPMKNNKYFYRFLKPWLIIMIIFLLFSIGSVYSVTIYLKNGEVLEGKIINEERTKVFLKTNDDKVYSISRSKIQKIKYPEKKVLTNIHLIGIQGGINLAPFNAVDVYTYGISGVLFYENHNLYKSGFTFLKGIPGLFPGASLKFSSYPSDEKKFEPLSMFELSLYVGHKFSFGKKQKIFLSPVLGYRHCFGFHKYKNKQYSQSSPSALIGIIFDLPLTKKVISGLSAEYIYLFENKPDSSLAFYLRIGYFF